MPELTDGHRPVMTTGDAGLIVVGCECGDKPAKRPARMSMMHVWQQTHRRRLGLVPVEYRWPDEAWAAARQSPQIGVGGPLVCRGYHWAGGGWRRDANPVRAQVLPVSAELAADIHADWLAEQDD
jgi:hypothetical protein